MIKFFLSTALLFATNSYAALTTCESNSLNDCAEWMASQGLSGSGAELRVCVESVRIECYGDYESTKEKLLQCAASYVSLYDAYSTTDSNYRSCVSSYNSCASERSGINGSYNSCIGDRNNLNAAYNTCMSDKNGLNAVYNTAYAGWVAVTKQLNAANTRINKLKKACGSKCKKL